MQRDCTSNDTKNWLSGSLNGHMVVQLQLVFCMLSTDKCLTYVQRFNITSPPPGHTTDVGAAGLYVLKHAMRSNGKLIRDVLPLSYLHSPVHSILHFGKTANARLTKYISYELLNEFWLNHYWNKQIYYLLLAQ
ncbi:hypothetical protein JVT61DRAFT_3 [Boletus reticuloceps]|uniref:Uncharacterized protein n=1 Tax=Boletus reticuloceps TaxID=495285 RepID=A0A8I3AGD0_9AGAM|nr:hypothetical protein JVT61DRAFT_3 [Boletus reticuloceps]